MTTLRGDSSGACERLSIAMLVGRFPVLSESFVLDQVTGLLRRGHSVDIFALDGPSAAVAVHPDVDQHHLGEHVYAAPVIPRGRAARASKALCWAFSAGAAGLRPALRALGNVRYDRQTTALSVLAAATLPRRLHRYDVIHCQFGMFGLIGAELRGIGALRGKLVVSFRGMDISRYVRDRGPDVYKSLFGTADAFLPNCDYFKQRLRALGCDDRKIVVLRTGIDCRQFPFSPPRPPLDGRVRIASVGRLIEKKGIEYLIHAVSRLVRSGKKIECVIVGGGRLEPYLRRLADDLTLGDVVTFLGPLIRPGVIEVLQKSHIFAAPSVAAVNGDEDAPVNVLKEAMAIGLPVVSTKHGGIPELVEDGVSGFLVAERDIEALADRLAYLIDHPSTWPRFGCAGRSRVEKEYNLDVQNDRLVEIYHRTLRGQLPLE